MFEKYYSLSSPEELKAYLLPYLQMVKHVCHSFDIDLNSSNFSGDHLGVQVLDANEFENVSEMLSKYSTKVKDNLIHERRFRIFKLNTPLDIDGVVILDVEIFEPKPGADLSKLKPGIEHVSFRVSDYDGFFFFFYLRKVPIGKSNQIGKSKLVKTRFLNLVEVEFRNDSLSEIA